jgi:hypothetical protein
MALMALVLAQSATAGIVFTPHLSEYGLLPRGAYADHTLIYTSIDKIYDAQGKKVPLANGNIPPGETTDIALALFRYLWVGNVFENTNIPVLKDHNQIFRIIANAGWQQASGNITSLSRMFGQKSSNSGIGDVFILGGIYSQEHRIGPFQYNGLLATTVKLPIGDYDQNSLLNNGTHYSTVIPQVAFHVEGWGRLYVDGTLARQFNGNNDSPSYGGLTPTEPADVVNAEINMAYKFNERWFVDVGIGRRKTVGSNKFGKVTLNFKQPVPPSAACRNLNIPTAQCNLATNFRLVPVPGIREDSGAEGTLMTAGFYYVYRSSTVFGMRVAQPIRGKGSQFPMEYDVVTDPGGVPLGAGARQRTLLTGVQEAASIPASPYYELRMVYLFWAP